MHTVRSRGPCSTRLTLAVAATTLTVGLAACGTDTAGAGAGPDVADVPLIEEPYIGPYDASFAAEMDTRVGQVVSLSADVAQVLTPEAFTIAAADDPTVEELLVVGATGDTALSPEKTVEVTGTVQESFTVREAEAELGADLDDALFAEWEQEPYLIADSVEVPGNAQG